MTCERVTVTRGGSIRGEGIGRSPPPQTAAGQKNRDARPIKSRFYQSQNAPKVAFLSSKSKKKFLVRGHSLPTPNPSRRLWRLDPRAYGARLDLRLRRRRSTSAPGVSIRPLATPSGSAPECTEQPTRLHVSLRQNAAAVNQSRSSGLIISSVSW